jgi:hypothetical protein
LKLKNDVIPSVLRSKVQSMSLAQLHLFLRQEDKSKGQEERGG